MADDHYHDHSALVKQHFNTSMAALDPDDTVRNGQPVGSEPSDSSNSNTGGEEDVDVPSMVSDVEDNQSNEAASDRESNNDYTKMGQEATVAGGVHDNSLFSNNSFEEQEESTSMGTALSLLGHGKFNTEDGVMRASTAPASMLSSTDKTVASSTTSLRTALTMPRAATGDCGRKHESDNNSWGPGWKISTLPIWRQPASPANRLFDAIKESRPGREPKELVERLKYCEMDRTPWRQQKPATAGGHPRLALKSWNSSTLTSTPESKKPHSSEISSVDNNSSSGRLLSMQQSIGQPSSKKAESPARNKKRSKVPKEWNISTVPHWKPTFKFNQFEYITDTRSSPPAAQSNRYTGVKAQYLKPSKRHMKLREERKLESQRREDYRQRDMKYYYIYNTRIRYRTFFS